jgi:hypothetical protein
VEPSVMVFVAGILQLNQKNYIIFSAREADA